MYLTPAVSALPVITLTSECVALKAWSGLPEGQIAGTSDALQTPGVYIFFIPIYAFGKTCITNLLSLVLL